MAYVVYILFSPACRRTYVGQSEDFDSRLASHNAGKVRSTKACRPWRLIHSEVCEIRSEAMKREKWYKSRTGRKRIAELMAELESNRLSVPIFDRDEISFRQKAERTKRLSR